MFYIKDKKIRKTQKFTNFNMRKFEIIANNKTSIRKNL